MTTGGAGVLDELSKVCALPADKEACVSCVGANRVWCADGTNALGKVGICTTRAQCSGGAAAGTTRLCASAAADCPTDDGTGGGDGGAGSAGVYAAIFGVVGFGLGVAAVCIVVGLRRRRREGGGGGGGGGGRATKSSGARQYQAQNQQQGLQMNPMRGGGGVPTAQPVTMPAVAAGGGGGGQWETVVDKASGNPYYYNSVTGETSWDPPAGGVVQVRSHSGSVTY